ncbi:MAG: hypothetical protein DI628_07330 [Blastochloris viridis]|uniref:Uncharacterized protein n=1 Tax=Blastochloris viridis TaxID=1079 RepID=A0A6N4RBT9_BLAVI|nr:MAG: hypothetical protein DI628_07330 [Blastochloris viridis]
MAKIGLAAELAKQAAQAAREEVAALSGEAPVAAASAPKLWKVPVLSQDFQLDEAVERATLRVAGHYRQALAPQGVDVGLENVPANAEEQAAAEMSQDDPYLQASLREQVSGRLIKAYTTPALLTMFAAQQQATGIVVDGQV